MTIRKLFKKSVDLTFAFTFFPIIVLYSIACRLIHRKREKPYLLWGALPIKTLTYTSRALCERGYYSKTVTIDLYPIVSHVDFDYVLLAKNQNLIIRYIRTSFNKYIFFLKSLFTFDIFHYFYDGGVLQDTPYKYIELAILKFCKKKLILLPYGSDAFVYDGIDPCWRHALLSSYSLHGSRSASIQKMLRFGAVYADVICGCLVHIVNLPRWDILPLTWYPIDTKNITPEYPKGDDEVVTIAHAPNHRGAKGSEFLIDAVNKLNAQGYKIKLLLIEKKTNTEALEIMKKADIIVDQLIFGYALNALEAMALGKIVITGIEKNNAMYKVFERYSYLKECSAFFASPESIYQVLFNILHIKDKWREIGVKTRKFVEKRHSFQASSQMFEDIYSQIYKKNKPISLINYFHPLFENFNEDSPSS